MDILFEVLGQVGVPAFLILIGWIVGRSRERRHLKSLDERELELAHIYVTDIKTFPPEADTDKTPVMVLGQSVIASDYLKIFLSSIRKIFGGELKSYQTLLLRARREALVRMMTEARDRGYNAVCNVRMDTSDIGGTTGGGRKGMVTVGMLASGTAYLIPQE